MPNWCYTNITITHNDEEKVKNLENLINEWTSKDYMKNGFGHTWLGNVVLGANIGTVDTNPKTDIRCRGKLSNIDRNGNELIINTETAWAPMMQIWKKVIDKYLPDAEILYTAEECDCGLYYTNDPDVQNHYCIDSWDCEEIESDYEATEDRVIEVLQELLDTAENDIETLFEMFEDSNCFDSMSINEWKFVDIDELN